MQVDASREQRAAGGDAIADRDAKAKDVEAQDSEVPIDPCADYDPSAGEPECLCESGYQHTNGPSSSRENIDECADDPCDENAECTNKAGGFECRCDEGYRGDGFDCEDIDECEEKADDCDENATCENTSGDFICSCNPGFDGNGEIYLMNVDGSDVTNLTNSALDESTFGARWSPDGTHISFTTYTEDNDEVYVMEADGSSWVNVSQHAFDDSGAKWSPTILP